MITHIIYTEAGTPRTLAAQRFSTETLPARDQYPFWSEAVCDVFVGLECRRDTEGPFFGSVLRRVVEIEPGESASFIHVASEPQSAARLPRHIRRSSDAWIMLVMQTEGPALLQQEGRTAALGPGDMVLFDSTRPYQFVFGRPFQQLVMKIPHRRLAARLPLPALWLGRAMSAASPRRLPLQPRLPAALRAHAARLSLRGPGEARLAAPRNRRTTHMSGARPVRRFGGVRDGPRYVRMHFSR